MSRRFTTRSGHLAGCAGRACACVLVGAFFVSPAFGQETPPQGQERDPFDTTQSDESKVKVSEYMTVDLHVQGEELANVLQMLSIQSERNIVMSSDISATVTADLYNVTFFEALEAILNVNGYGYIERGSFIYVYTLDEIKQIEQENRIPVSKVIKLDYLNGNDAAEFVSPLLSEIGQIKTNGDVDTFNVPDDTPIGDEQYALEAVVVVYDYPEHVEAIEKLIKQLDTKPSQVLVEATILQTALNEANAFGVDFAFLNNINFTDFMNVGGPLSAAGALITGGSATSGSGGTGGTSGTTGTSGTSGSGSTKGLSPANNHAIAGVSSVGKTSEPGGFKLAVIQDDFSVFIKLLDEVTDTTVIANPKILAVNRTPARVLVGQRIGFLNTTSTQTSTTQTVDFLDTGTKLSFRPFISSNGDIRMELNPSVSEGVIRNSSNSTGANVTIPDEITQEITTNVIVHDGSTIVLGGLFKEKTQVGRSQVPFIGDIPIIGAAFRGHDNATSRSEIIFLITPTIMNDDVLIAQGDRAIDEVSRVRAGTRTGLLPWSRDRMTAKLNMDAERLAGEGDTQRALWKLRRSLNLNAEQPAALRLREQLLENRTLWPSRSILDRVFDKELGVPSSAPTPASSAEPATSTADQPLDQNVSKPTSKSASTTVAPLDGATGRDNLSDEGAVTSSRDNAADGQAHLPDEPVDQLTDDLSNLKLTVTMTPPDRSLEGSSPSASDLTVDPVEQPRVQEPEASPEPLQNASFDQATQAGVDGQADGQAVSSDAAHDASAQTGSDQATPPQASDEMSSARSFLSSLFDPEIQPIKPMTEGVASAPAAWSLIAPAQWPMEMRFWFGDGPIPPGYSGLTLTGGWRTLRDIFIGAPRFPSSPPAIATVDPEQD